ncbi:LuxR C-terminal-related transcriptional regulator [Arthrobacter sp. RIT-PI-e]|uniref:LuxR C-terminal-related transcriptional regulator n=1 Tax=Arthrobacter sp. RIT-PI-e TaxID=1681197 RepID=UPI000A88B608|nr:helix-turn-helix transcriptional regulator [Arthrobacter sp. RIT-PI-e]
MGFLVDRSSELETALLQPQNFEPTHSGQWLAQRYQEIVPLILPDVLNCLDTGEPLSRNSVEVVRGSAQAVIVADVPLRTVLHGGVPALRVFSAFLKPHHSHLSTAELSTILGRASLVATELAACWAQAWSELHRSGTPSTEVSAVPPRGTRGVKNADAGATDDSVATPLDLVPVPGHLDGGDLNMVLLAAQGHSNQEIAHATAYSPQAVKWHLGRVMRLWNVRNRASLITTALLRGALRPRPALTSAPRPTPSVDPSTTSGTPREPSAPVGRTR